MLSLVRTALLPAGVYLLPAGRSHVCSGACRLSVSGLLPGFAGLSRTGQLPAQLLPMAAPRRRQRLLRINDERGMMNDECRRKSLSAFIIHHSAFIILPNYIS